MLYLYLREFIYSLIHKTGRYSLLGNNNTLFIYSLLIRALLFFTFLIYVSIYSLDKRQS